ncbi:energy-coupling factor transporter transmembrane component T family protein [Nonomuraea rubra]|uniref:Energy-coupling factor transport system permease protein n=1 Tax=Nonomuraea rubra TaxID=46180 RepID=A0A7X0U2W5_9ACTN|nr:energy-coupling factor transporter transmembrane component T [Nonomuraea rubra]MBB6553277.1 energy-coupling factor transport system permease protein [Nonomuraea rubra]
MTASPLTLPGQVTAAVRVLRLDPRTKVLLVLSASAAVMAPGGERFIPAALVLGLLLALGEGAWMRVAALPLTAAVVAAVAYLLPMAAPHPAVGVIATVAAYALRFVAVAGIALHLMRTTTPTQLTAALRAARVPRAITVSAAVMLRFLPVIVTEARAVHDAMRLRGIGGWGGLLRHPVLSIERFTVPLIASSLRVAEDLSASALLRGLGSATRPTALHPPRLGVTDLVAVLVAAALITVTVLW